MVDSSGLRVRGCGPLPRVRLDERGSACRLRGDWSVQRTSIAPKFWVASSRLTITFLRDSSTAPLQAHRVISAIGVTNTVSCLEEQVAPVWQETVQALRPGLSYVALYLGFDGDVIAAGATAAN